MYKSAHILLLELILRRFRAQTQVPWSSVRVLLLYGDKYDVPEFREEGRRLLSGVFPTEIEDWDKVHKADDHSTWCMQFSAADIMSMADVTESLGHRDLYGAIHYYCCFLDLVDVVAGKSDGIDPVLRGVHLRRFLRGRENLPKEWIFCLNMAFSDIEPENTDRCSSSSTCSRVRAEIGERTLEYSSNQFSLAYRVIEAATYEHLWQRAQSMGMCTACVDAHREQHSSFRAYVRDQGLDYIFLYVHSFDLSPQ